MSSPSPAPRADSAAWAARADKVLAPTYGRPDHLFVEGEGNWLVTDAGERFLDMTAGVAVNALGHGAAVIQDALQEAAAGLVHTSNLFHTRPAIELAERLVASSFASSVFFCNSGAEATEGCIKFARLAAGEGRHRVLAFSGSFHGRTTGALACTDRPAYRAPFEPLMGDVDFAEWGSDAALDAIDETLACVIAEPIQGEGGVREPPTGWLRKLRERCDATGTLLVFDEVQTGLGRTGTLWAYEHEGVEPDLMGLAKPIAGGLPMGVVLLGERATQAVTPSCHASTFGGGPLVATVACRVFDAVQAPGFLEGVREREQHLRKALAELNPAWIDEIRGRGLLLGVKVRADAKAVAAAAARRHLLLAMAGDNVLRLLPSLDAPHADLDRAVAILGEALAEVHQEKESEA